eukprot:7965161-Alexandrium_andersonii.AAC.1
MFRDARASARRLLRRVANAARLLDAQSPVSESARDKQPRAATACRESPRRCSADRQPAERNPRCRQAGRAKTSPRPKPRGFPRPTQSAVRCRNVVQQGDFAESTSVPPACP